MIRVAICDDEASDRVRLRTMAAAYEASLEFTEYNGGEPLVWDIETVGVRFDLYFLDIYLDGLSGVETARRIRAQDEEALIIFVTRSEDFYKDSYDLFAFNYLVKPVDNAVLERVLGKAVERLKQEAQQVLRFTYRTCTYSLKYSEIDYIASENRLLIYHLHNGETRQCYGKLDELAAKLPSEVFVRCHQSYFVNLNRVTALEPKGFLLGGSFIPISRAYSETARELYRRHLFGVFEQE